MFLRKKTTVPNAKTEKFVKMDLKTTSNSLNVKSVRVDL
jgi:hypothetical protein